MTGLTFDVDGGFYQCSKCGAEFDEGTWGIDDWVCCPMCGEQIAYVEDRNAAREAYEDEYRRNAAALRGVRWLRV